MGFQTFLRPFRDTFLSLAGPDVFDIVLSLTDPVPYETKTKAEIIELLSAYFTPKDMVLINTFKFGTRSQKPEETAAEYSTALRAMAKGCEYGQYLERALRDRFVIGLYNPYVRESLFKRGRELSFQEAIAFATTSELASAHSRMVGGPSTSAVVGQTSVSRPARGSQRGRSVAFVKTAGKCPGCNGDHQRPQCPYRSAVCEYCKSTGHVAKVCRKKAAARNRSKSRPNDNNNSNNNQKSKTKILDEFPEVFKTSLGKYVGPPLDLNFDPAIKPIRFRPRRIPIGIKDKVDAAIESLVAQDVLESVADTVWGTPVVPILKKDGSIRLCGDYKITINKAIK